MKNYNDRVDELILIQAMAEGCDEGFVSLGCSSIRTICRTIREERFKLQPPLTPIAGPPDLEGASDDALFLVSIEEFGTPQCVTRKFYDEGLIRFADTFWHIPLGAITPPEPEMPTCPWCGEAIELKSGWFPDIYFFWAKCTSKRCGAVFPKRDTEAEAIAAADAFKTDKLDM